MVLVLQLKTALKLAFLHGINNSFIYVVGFSFYKLREETSRTLNLSVEIMQHVLGMFHFYLFG